MTLKIKAIGYRSEAIYATVNCDDTPVGTLTFGPTEWDAFISALKIGAPQSGLTLNIDDDTEDDTE